MRKSQFTRVAVILILLCAPISTGAAEPPEGAIQLFDGNSLEHFTSMSGENPNWPIEDGALVSTPNRRRSNNLVSRLHFRNADIHVEFLLPESGDGNSGLYLHGLYEIQILNSRGRHKPTDGDLGALYNLHPPMVNACRAAGEWQTLDVHFEAPRRDHRGEIQTAGRVSAWLNGQQIHDGAEVGQETSKYNPFEYDTTSYLKEMRQRMSTTMAGPLILQDHDSPVRFRSIWVKPLDDDNYWYTASKNRAYKPAD